jgi:hypothetical protein
MVPEIRGEQKGTARLSFKASAVALAVMPIHEETRSHHDLFY